MSRIRTKRQARKLRPIAQERARHSKFRVGDIAFFGGIGWYPVEVRYVHDLKPFRVFLVRGAKNGGYFSVTGRGMFTDREECSSYGGVVNV